MSRQTERPESRSVQFVDLKNAPASSELRGHGTERLVSMRRKLSVEERFWSKVRKGDLCWAWMAGKVKGYGTFWDGTRTARAHRFAYELLVGPIPDGLDIDHLCRNRGCVNPDHMEVVTNRQNVLRGIGPTAENAVKTHCAHGHPFSPENTHIRPSGRRTCRACHRAHLKRTSAISDTRSGDE